MFDKTKEKDANLKAKRIALTNDYYFTFTTHKEDGITLKNFLGGISLLNQTIECSLTPRKDGSTRLEYKETGHDDRVCVDHGININPGTVVCWGVQEINNNLSQSTSKLLCIFLEKFVPFFGSKEAQQLLEKTNNVQEQRTYLRQ